MSRSPTPTRRASTSSTPGSPTTTIIPTTRTDARTHDYADGDSLLDDYDSVEADDGRTPRAPPAPAARTDDGRQRPGTRGSRRRRNRRFVVILAVLLVLRRRASSAWLIVAAASTTT